MATPPKQPVDLVKYLQCLEVELRKARRQADKAIAQYQTMRTEFYQWLKQADAEYLAKRTAKINEIEMLRQEMARIRMQHHMDLQRYRKAWEKTFGY